MSRARGSATEEREQKERSEKEGCGVWIRDEGFKIPDSGVGNLRGLACHFSPLAASSSASNCVCTLGSRGLSIQVFSFAFCV